MTKTVRKALLISMFLLVSGVSSLDFGARQWDAAAQQLANSTKGDGFTVTDTPGPDENVWQILGVIMTLIGIASAIATVMIWKRDRESQALNG